jgi:hypothetical protein
MAQPLDVWHPQRLNASGFGLSDITHANGAFVTVGARGDEGTIFGSNDGANWTNQVNPFGPATLALYSVAYGNSTFVAVGWSGAVHTSTNGAVWVKQQPEVGGATLRDVIFANGLFVAVGAFGFYEGEDVFTSPDGVTWTRRATGNTSGATLSGVAFGNGLLVAVGASFIPPDRSWISTSSDATNWTPRLIGLTNSGLTSIAFGNGAFAALSGTSVFTSTNGSNWVEHVIPTTNRIDQIHWAEGLFFALGDQGALFTSTDAAVWQKRDSGVTDTLASVTFALDSFFVVGSNGLILRSDPQPRLIVSGPGQLWLSGAPGQTCAVEMRDSLSYHDVWHSLVTITLTNSPTSYTDTTATNLPGRFYRLQAPQ